MAGEAPGAQAGRAVPYVLAACTAISILSTDLITPSIPDLPEELGTGSRAAQMTVGINLMAYAMAQLVHGPVADRIGRRRLLSIAFVAFAAVSVACAFAPTIEWLLAGRFVQGLVSSVPSVVVVLIIRELYDSQRALAVMALYGATLGLAPAMGPLLGGYLHVWFGWQAGFVLVAALALAVVVLLRRHVPETLRDPAPLELRRVLLTYRLLLGHRAFFGPMLGVSLCFGAFYAYITSAPVIFIDLLGMPTQRYGLTHIVIVIAFVIGNLVSAQLSKRMPAEAMLRGGVLVMVGAMLMLSVPIVAGRTEVFLIIQAMAIYGLALAIVLAAGPLVVLAAAEGVPQGSAAALLGSFQLGVAAIGGYAAALLFNDTAVPMALTMTAFVLGGAYLVWRPQRAAISADI